MASLSFRERFPYFLAVALAAGGAFVTGKALASAGRFARELYTGLSLLPPKPLPRITDWMLHFTSAAEGLPVAQTLCSAAAIVIASTGFLLVHRMPPERVARALLLLLSLAWALQVLLLIAALVGFFAPFAPKILRPA